MDTATQMAVSVDETAWHHLVPRLLSEHGSRTVAEVGVWRGELSERILDNCPSVSSLYLVDPWEVVYGHDIERDQWMVFGPGTTQQEMDEARRFVTKKFAKYGKVFIYQFKSLEAARLMTDRSFDTVLIDALHTYHACKQDILAWAPKVKVGGLMIGDDVSEWFPGVKVAVEACFGGDYRALGQTWWKLITEDDHVRLAGLARESVSQ